MSIVKPVFVPGNCCGGVRSSSGSGGFQVSQVAAQEVGAGSVVSEDPTQGWRRRAQSGQRYRVPIALYSALSRSLQPVRTVNRCGSDRDCVPGTGYFESYRQAMGNIFAWNRLGHGRSVEVYDAQSGALLGVHRGSDADYVEFLSSSRDEAEMQLIQNSPNAGRFGFLPI